LVADLCFACLTGVLAIVALVARLLGTTRESSGG
jgi:hypothetical protein